MRRSHDRTKGRVALHLVSAFAANSRLVLGARGRSTTRDQRNDRHPCGAREARRRPQPKRRRGAIGAIACNPQTARSIRDARADYLIAVKGNQPNLEAEIEAAFAAADKGQIEADVDFDKRHGRIETRTLSMLRQVDWRRRFPGEVRFVDAGAIVRVEARTELEDRSGLETCY